MASDPAARLALITKVVRPHREKNRVISASRNGDLNLVVELQFIVVLVSRQLQS